MIESAGQQSNAFNRVNARQKLDDEKKAVQTTKAESPDVIPLSSDEIDLNFRRAPLNKDRPEQDPLANQDEAGEVVSFTKDRLLADAHLAGKAQANLEPDKVLELIA